MDNTTSAGINIKKNRDTLHKKVLSVIEATTQKKDLDVEQITDVTNEMLFGKINDQDIAKVLQALADKGETDKELLGMLNAMMSHCKAIHCSQDIGTIIDMCGTGGDGLQTINVSTAASFVVAAVATTNNKKQFAIAKHGNRSSSGLSTACGSADIFEMLGCDLAANAVDITNTLEKHCISFIFAQTFHPAMKRVAAARRQLNRRTAFNVLGPLANPTNLKHQLVGVPTMDLLYKIPRILKKRGSVSSIVVTSGGMDEFSTIETNHVCTLKDNTITEHTITPEEAGLHRSELSEIVVKTKEEAISAFVKTISGTSTRAMIETVAINAAAGLVVAGVADTISEGVSIAMDTIHTGKALTHLERFVADTKRPCILEDLL